MMGVNGGVQLESEVCVCVQSGHASGLPQAWSLSLIDPAPLPHVPSQLQ